MSDSVDVDRLIRVLRELDAEQQRTESLGGREIAWYYYRGDVEAALNLEPGALDTGEYELTEYPMDRDKIIAHYLSKVREVYATEGRKYEDRLTPSWTDNAVKFITTLVERRPQLTTEEASMCVDLLFVCSQYVDDANDWDEVGNVLALMDWYWYRVAS